MIKTRGVHPVTTFRVVSVNENSAFYLPYRNGEQSFTLTLWAASPRTLPPLSRKPNTGINQQWFARDPGSIRGRYSTKQPIFGILFSNGTVWAEVIDDVVSDILQLLISKKGTSRSVNEDMSIVFSCLPPPAESIYGDTIKEMKMIMFTWDISSRYCNTRFNRRNVTIPNQNITTRGFSSVDLTKFPVQFIPRLWWPVL